MGDERTSSWAAVSAAVIALTLIDRRNFHLFQPLLYQVATGALSPVEIASPLRVVLRAHPNTEVLPGEPDIEKRRAWLTFAIVGRGARCSRTAAGRVVVEPGTWKDLLERITRAPNAPAVIVSSRLPDDRLWAEALNLGAWDVLARPFVRSEVFRAVSAAWRYWWNQQERSTPPMKVMKAAGCGATASAAAHR